VASDPIALTSPPIVPKDPPPAAVAAREADWSFTQARFCEISPSLVRIRATNMRPDGGTSVVQSTGLIIRHVSYATIVITSDDLICGLDRSRLEFECSFISDSGATETLDAKLSGAASMTGMIVLSVSDGMQRTDYRKRDSIVKNLTSRVAYFDNAKLIEHLIPVAQSIETVGKANAAKPKKRYWVGFDGNAVQTYSTQTRLGELQSVLLPDSTLQSSRVDPTLTTLASKPAASFSISQHGGMRGGAVVDENGTFLGLLATGGIQFNTTGLETALAPQGQSEQNYEMQFVSTEAIADFAKGNSVDAFMQLKHAYVNGGYCLMQFALGIVDYSPRNVELVVTRFKKDVRQRDKSTRDQPWRDVIHDDSGQVLQRRNIPMSLSEGHFGCVLDLADVDSLRYHVEWLVDEKMPRCKTMPRLVSDLINRSAYRQPINQKALDELRQPTGDEFPSQTILLPQAMASFIPLPKQRKVLGLGGLTGYVYEILVDEKSELAIDRRIDLGQSVRAGVAHTFGKPTWYFSGGDKSEIIAVNPDTHEIVERLATRNHKLFGLAASLNSADPYLYYVTKDGIGVYHLNKKQDLGIQIDAANQVAVSADGSQVYAGRFFNGSGSATAYEVERFSDRASIALKAKQGIGDSFGSMVVDPIGKQFASGSFLYDQQLRRGQNTHFQPQGFFDSSDLILATNKTSDEGQLPRYLQLMSRRGVAIGNQIPLSPAFLPSKIFVGNELIKGRQMVESFSSKSFIAAIGQSAICATGNKISRIKVDAFGVKPTSLRSVETDRFTAMIGRENRLPITVQGKVDRWYIDPLPLDAFVESDNVVWVPGEEQLGSHTWQVKLVQGDETTEVPIYVDVVRGSLTLPFKPDHLLVDSNERFVVAWSGRQQELEPQKVTSVGCQLTVIPLTGQTKPKVIQLREEANRVTVNGSTLLVETANGSVQNAYDLVSLELLPQPKEVRYPLEPGGISVYLQGILSDQILYRGMPAKPALLLNGELGIPVQAQVQRASPDKFLLNRDRQLTTLEGTQLGLNQTNQVDPPLPFAVRSLIRGNPTELTLPSGFANDGRELRPLCIKNSATGLTLFDVLHSDIDASNVSSRSVGLRIEDTSAMSQRTMWVAYEESRSLGAPMALAIGGKHAYVSVGNRLHRISLAEIVADSSSKKSQDAAMIASLPLHLEPIQSDFVFRKGSISLKHTALGGRPPYEFRADQDLEGFSVDAKTGTASIDAAALPNLYSKAIDSVIAMLAQQSRLGQPEPPITSETPAPQLIKTLMFICRSKISSLEFWNSLQIHGMSFSIPIAIRVRDAEGHEAIMHYYVLSEVSPSNLQRMLQRKNP
jgi:hypothetical protein